MQTCEEFGITVNFPNDSSMSKKYLDQISVVREIAQKLKAHIVSQNIKFIAASVRIDINKYVSCCIAKDNLYFSILEKKEDSWHLRQTLEWDELLQINDSIFYILKSSFDVLIARNHIINPTHNLWISFLKKKEMTKTSPDMELLSILKKATILPFRETDNMKDVQTNHDIDFDV